MIFSENDKRVFVVYLGLGSNIGDTKQNLLESFSQLSLFLTDPVLSPVIESESVNQSGSIEKDAPRYANAAAKAKYQGTLSDLLNSLQNIEIKMGRNTDEKGQYKPRIIDLDILRVFVDGKEVFLNTELLTIPHPRIDERVFVTEPLKKLGLS
ncbi:MAG: 2-amino-4-hydroxy-6-hydroxymethyldihydropteridine diphosphokinase [Candidatus Lindowbacteria bacterium]|nr:2-amino-4-hydroxy-6-hydroxymethyldihydropteridine diphosphokinase [Candidatus Lindowbacteria bacterium]